MINKVVDFVMLHSQCFHGRDRSLLYPSVHETFFETALVAAIDQSRKDVLNATNPFNQFAVCLEKHSRVIADDRFSDFLFLFVQACIQVLFPTTTMCASRSTYHHRSLNRV
jgi:hypothetical protein